MRFRGDRGPRGWGVVLVLTVAFTVLAAGTAQAADSIIRSKHTSSGWRWRPKHDYVTRGDTVRWKVPASQGTWHDVHSYGSNWSFSVSRLDPGDGANHTFNSTGAYKYRCVRHSSRPPGEPCHGMCGTVHVLAN
jgi:plastocyanin